MNDSMLQIIEDMHEDTRLNSETLEELVEALNERSALLYNNTVNLIDPEEAPKISQIAYIEFKIIIENEIEPTESSVISQVVENIYADLEDIIINGDTASDEEFISFMNGIVFLAPKHFRDYDKIQETVSSTMTYCLVNDEIVKKVAQEITLPLILCPIPRGKLFFGCQDAVVITFYDDASLVVNEDGTCTFTLPMEVAVSKDLATLISDYEPRV